MRPRPFRNLILGNRNLLLKQLQLCLKDTRVALKPRRELPMPCLAPFVVF
jgi:hypothetical protein